MGSTQSREKENMLNQELLVLLPAHNEEQSIRQTINTVLQNAPHAEIVVIDNQSSDRTIEIAISAGAQVIREPQLGKGFAVRKGFSLLRAEHRAVFMVDADDTYDISQIEQAFKLVTTNGYDMVVGKRVRFEATGSERRPDFKRGHRLGNQTFTILGKLLHPVGIEDSLSGWRMFSANFVQSFTGGASGFEIEAELNGHADLLKCAVTNLEVGYRGRNLGSNSKLNTYRDGLRILRRNLSIFRNDHPFVAFGFLWVPILTGSIALTERAISGYVQTGRVEQLPSLVAGVGGLIVSGLLWVTGMILERAKQIRASMARYEFNRREYR